MDLRDVKIHGPMPDVRMLKILVIMEGKGNIRSRVRRTFLALHQELLLMQSFGQQRRSVMCHTSIYTVLPLRMFT